MQLNGKSSVKSALALASSVLIGSGAAQANRVESTVLIYSEQDRVSAAESSVSYSHELDENQSLKLKLTFDALTGASPNGAAPSKDIQTFTRPSGQGVYTTNAGDIPLDDTFKDTRFALSGSYARKLGRLNNVFVGGHFSGEHDYTSMGVNGGISRDFNQRNTTVSLSVSFSSDKIKPEGGVPIPFSSLPMPGETLNRLGPDDTKKVYDLLLGVTQTIDHTTLMRVNYSYSRSTGYLSDPYKIVSIVQDESSPDPGEPVDYIYESRPDKRNKQSVYSQIRKYIGGSTVDLSYRYYWDDWGLNSHTVNLFYNFSLKNGHSLEPHIRWYHQSASDYYVPSLIENQTMPDFASADYRIGKMSALTLGMQYMIPINNGNELKFMFEYYTQYGDSSPPGTIGSQLNYDMFPTLNAFMVRFGYNFNLK